MQLDRLIAVRNTKSVFRVGNRSVKVFSSYYSKADVLNEALNHARVEETGLNVPKLLEVTKIDGKWAIAYEYIEGRTLAELMDSNPDKKDEYITLMVKLHLEVLDKVCPQLNKLKDKINIKICESELDATTRYDLHTRLDSMPKHNKLCHGDFNPSNIVIGNDGKTYIIDWAHATQGNASADAARTYLLFRLRGDESGAKRYLDLFSENSGISQMNIQKWLPIVAASQSVVSNEREKELLLSRNHILGYDI